MYTINPLKKLIEQFRQLPGIGQKSATRIAYFVLQQDKKKVIEFTESVIEAKNKILYCSTCFNFTDCDPCVICCCENRDKSKICIVEEPQDVAAVERTKEFHGLYHVLHGALSPIEGIGPGELKLKELFLRLHDNVVQEIILAINPDVEGEATSIYLAKLLKPIGVKVTKIAHGLPVGGDLEYADEVTLAKALENRQII